MFFFCLEDFAIPLGEKRDNWLLAAYEKKENESSGGSMDIVPEPEGKQNGTAPL